MQPTAVVPAVYLMQNHQPQTAFAQPQTQTIQRSGYRKGQYLGKSFKQNVFFFYYYYKSQTNKKINLNYFTLQCQWYINVHQM